MSIVLSPTTSVPGGNVRASGTANRKVGSSSSCRIIAEGSVLSSFSVPSNNKYSVTIKAPTGSDRTVAVDLQQLAPGSKWVTTSSANLAILSGAQPPPTFPSVPQSLAATGGVTGGVTLTWSAPSSTGGSAVLYYRVYRDAALVGSPSATTFSMTGLSNGTSYLFSVSAVNAIGEGPRTSPIAFTPSAPSLPPGGIVVPAGTDINNLLAAGNRVFYLRGGIHRFSLGAVETNYANVSLLAYPNEQPMIDGTGLDPHMVYLGPSSGTWKITDVDLRNFFPTGSGVIGIGDNCRLEMTRGSMVGKGGSPSNQDHGVYFHGTGTGLLTTPNITNFPGSALQSYRGTPNIVVNGGTLHGLYIGVFCYSGAMDMTGVDIRGTLTYDIDVQTPATATLTNCTGRGVGGVPKRYDHS